MNPAVERTLGRLFRAVHAGERHLAWNAPGLSEASATVRLASPAFADGAPIPTRHAAPGVGENLSPPLAWSNVPPGAAELVLIVQDPGAPLPQPVVHLIALGIAPDATFLPEGALTPGHDQQIQFGRGTFGRVGYSGPRPVLGHGPHTYVFQIFALSRPLGVTGTPDLATVLDKIGHSVLARGRLSGTYERP